VIELVEKTEVWATRLVEKAEMWATRPSSIHPGSLTYNKSRRSRVPARRRGADSNGFHSAAEHVRGLRVAESVAGPHVARES